MPNIKSAIKSLRQDKKKQERNKATISEVRTLIKSARVLISEKKSKEADTVLKKAESRLDKAAKKKVIKKNTAARKISRLRSQWSKIETKA